MLSGACLVALLYGCNHSMFDDELRGLVRAKLNDPDSAQFGKSFVTEKLKGTPCIGYNAKNLNGGYQGIRTALLFKVPVSGNERRWSVDSMDGKFECTESGLDAYVDALRNAPIDISIPN